MKKELSIEEKAKAYDNIIEKANKMYSDNCETCQMCIEELIPELKESEDERIRKVLIELSKEVAQEQFFTNRGTNLQNVIAWLEKQGEQKPNYCHHEVDLSNCSEEYTKGYYDGWNNCNQQHAQLEAEQNLTWSKEDENRFKNLVYLVEHSDEGIATKVGFVKFINRLKSLSPQNGWKPSDDQMEVLLSEVLAWIKGCPKQKVLESLYNDLNKLREE